MTLGRLVGTTFVQLDGQVRSVQPGGAIQTRPSGTNGNYEQVAVDGSIATYAPSFEGTVEIYQYPFVRQVPGQDAGVCAMGNIAL